MARYASTATPNHAAHQSRDHGAIFAISFVVFLLAALVGQLFGWPWRSWLPGAEGAPSLFGGVKSAVYTSMSHLL
jgi:light-harvesting complex 1 beta chain